jgi:glyceraldehyde-3-phosphate dehydrogenase (NAD(P))
VKTRVLVVGYGTIGKRVADAVMAQGDMELAGVCTPRPNANVLALLRRTGEIPLVACDKESEEAFRRAGITTSGMISGLLSSGEVDVVVDASPGGVGAENKRRFYSQSGVRVVFQGGEEPGVAEVTFSPFFNYDVARGRKYVRVPSCNTTGILRVLNALGKVGTIEEVFVAILRRAHDPADRKGARLNTVTLDGGVPSHHARDVKLVLPVNITTVAAVAPTTLSHFHMARVRFAERGVTKDEVVEALSNAPRVVLAGEPFNTTADLAEFFRELRSRGDMFEVAVLEQSVAVDDGYVVLAYVVHQESVVVPENIDAVRALATDVPSVESVRMTDSSLGVLSGRISLAVARATITRAEKLSSIL